MMSFAGLTLECGGVTEWPNVPVLKTDAVFRLSLFPQYVVLIHFDSPRLFLPLPRNLRNLGAT